MNIYVLESSMGPDDMTEQEGKLPAWGQKGSVGKDSEPILTLLFLSFSAKKTIDSM